VKLTSEQRDAITAPEDICLVSCPGSGKTRTIIAKLLLCIEKVRDSTRRVACITHTNAGADEIDIRLRQTCFSGEDRYYHVATIHSFALQTILRPFHRLLPEFCDGFQILTSSDEVYVQKRNDLMARYGIDRRRAEDFENIQRAPDARILFPEGFPEAAAREWFSWLDASSYVSLSDIVYHSCRVITQHDFITSALASRYAWILVDEFQDSSPGQIFLLKKISAFGRTQFFCVGDPNQSIYGFAGASPTLLTDFADHASASKNHQLSGNFRSSSHIVSVAERLIQTTPAMTARGKYRDCPLLPEWHHCSSPLLGILDKFIPAAKALNLSFGQMAVLAPTWFTLFPLARGLRAKGIPIIGPGARPYKRDNPFSQIAEAVGAYLESREPDIALAVQRSLFITLSNITGEPPWSVFSYHGRVVVCQLLAEATAAHHETNQACKWLELAAERFTEILLEADLLPSTQGNVLPDSAKIMGEEIIRNTRGQQLTIEDLGIFARPRNCIHLMTIHKAKGREFEAVAVVDAHDGKIPHFSYRLIADPLKKLAAYDESRRVFYVATTRAERLLMYFTDDSDYRNRPSPFLIETCLPRTIPSTG
jgi:DNA helicase-2/ATP-dependent DNA helicase PcrA